MPCNEWDSGEPACGTCSHKGKLRGEAVRCPVFTTDTEGRKVAEIELSGHFFAKNQDLLLEGERLVTVTNATFIRLLELGHADTRLHI